MSITVSRLTTSIGAQVTGVDLTQRVTTRVAEGIRQALAEHSVLLFREQNLTDEQHAVVAEIFGQVTISPSRKLFGLNDSIRVIERGLFNREDEGTIPYAPRRDEFRRWHADETFCEQIPAVATLRPIALAPEGGDTCWSSMGAVYESLSPPLQQWLETLNAVHAAQPGFRATVGFYDLPKDEQRRFNEEKAARAHPMVVRQPVTGRKILFVNPVFTATIEGLNSRESASLLRYLFSEAVRAEVVYRHHWRMGDLVVWDEISTIHVGPENISPERQLVRIYSGLTTPTAAQPHSTVGSIEVAPA